MHVFSIVRYSVHAWLLVCSLIILGLMANFISLLRGFSFSTFNFGIVVALFTMIFIGVTHVLAHVSPTAPTNMILVEIAWTGLLWIFWVAFAGSLSSLGILSQCDLLRGEAESQCRQFQASQAFAWLGWLAIMGWWCTLLTFTIIAHTRGNGRIWFEYTKDVPFFNAKNINDKYNMNSAPTGNSNFAPQSMNSQASYNYPTMQSNGTGAYPSQPQQFNNV